MAGHSQFKNIMHRKGAQDLKRAKLFTKIIREIFVAAKMSPDPDFNPRLRNAIDTAKAANLPKDKVTAAINKASSSENNENYEEIRYEGYGPVAVAVIVEAITDNRNRTASEIRSAFSKYGGNLAESNSVGFMFRKIGLITYPLDLIDVNTMFEISTNANAIDYKNDAQYHYIYCDMTYFNNVKDILEEKFGSANFASIIWEPLNFQEVTKDNSEKIDKLIEALQECDDVQNVITNAHVL